MNKDLKVIGLTKRMLRDSIDQNTYWKEGIAPMPKSKALWLVSNTRIDESDYCGVLGLENGKIIAFIYMFPDYLNTKDEIIGKAYWMIDWWVDKPYKDTVLSTYIYNEAIKLAENQILINGYSENVQDFYKKQPFKIIGTKLRHTIFFSLDSSMLIGKFNFLRNFKFFIDGVDICISSLIRFVNKTKLTKKSKLLKYQYINQLDDQTWAFLEPHFKNDLISKTKDYVNWQICKKQYIQTIIPHKQPYTNLQTGASDNIHLHNLIILYKNSMIGFLSYTVNYNEFNIKYFIVKNDTYYNLCVDALIENLIKSKRNFIFSDDTKLANTITKRYTTLFTHKVNKKVLAHNDTKFDFNNIKAANQDGNFY